jgi:carboxyl-terminal processing protease
MISKTYYFFLLVVVLWSMNLTFAQSSTALIKTETTAAKNLKIFDALWTKINEHYFDTKFNGVDWAKMKETYRPRAEKAESKNALLLILKEMLGELKTSHVEAWIAVIEKQLERKIGENFDTKRDSLLMGAGFDTKIIAGQHVVLDVYNNTPAKIAGVEPGWIMTAVGGVSVANRSLAGVFALAEGRKINYEFLNKEDKEINLTLETVIFVIKSARIARFLEDGAIGYLKFDGFKSGVADWVRQEMAKLNQAKTVIVDLRGNGGGLVEEVKDTLSPFFSKNVEFGAFVERNGRIREKDVKGSGDRAFAGKIIVLTDERSGSGSEIFSLIMQENRRAHIVGTKTRGAVLASREFYLPEDFVVRVAFRDYVSPKGVRLEGAGVNPDLEIDLTVEDIRAGRDGVLEQAIKLANEY